MTPPSIISWYRSLPSLVLEADDTALYHLVVQIIALPCPLAHTSKHGVPTMSLGHVVNQLHDEDSLADPGTTKQTNFSSFSIRSQQVDHLDASDEDLLFHAHLFECRCLGMNSLPLVSRDRTSLINRITNNIDDSAQSFRPNRNHDRITSVVHNIASNQSLCTVHSNCPHSILTEVLGHLQDQLGLPVLHYQGIKDFRETILELHVNNSSDYRHNSTLGESCG